MTAALSRSDQWLENECAEFRSGIVGGYPADIRAALETEWRDTAGPAPSRAPGARYHSFALANQALNARHATLRAAHAGIAFEESDISDRAERLAQWCKRSRSLDNMRQIASDAGIAPPDAKKTSETGQQKRLECPRWWRRKLHRYYSRVAEGALREMGMVHKHAGLYCSDATLNRRREQKHRQRDLLSEIAAVNELGEMIALIDLIDASIANPALRRAELMTRIAGFERVAEAAGHVGEFLTFTTPSRFHCRYSDGRKNRKYEPGNDPRAAQDWLCKAWARIRAQLKRDHVNVYGFRVAEPHHDGTTHWHLLLFVEPGRGRDRLRELCRAHLLADCGDERGAKKHRFKAVSIQPSKGSAAGYIAKYVAKNIDGHEVGPDDESVNLNALQTAARVDAWASTWGIRQFQQIGGPPVGIWRELRRQRDTLADSFAETVRAAADAGNWQEFCDALGGVELGRSVPAKLIKVDLPEVNEYGEPITDLIVGVVLGDGVAGFAVYTRTRAWFFVWTRDSGAAWTRVNNCTHSPPAVAGDLSRQTDPPQGSP